MARGLSVGMTGRVRIAMGDGDVSENKEPQEYRLRVKKMPHPPGQTNLETTPRVFILGAGAGMGGLILITWLIILLILLAP
jgi:hypothetical protein